MYRKITRYFNQKIMLGNYSNFFYLTDLDEMYTGHAKRYKEQPPKISYHFVQNCSRNQHHYDYLLIFKSFFKQFKLKKNLKI